MFEKNKNMNKADYFTVTRIDVSEVDGEFIRVTREKYNLSQTTFASILGVKVKTLVKWEKGKKKINNTTKTFIKILNNFPLVLYCIYSVENNINENTKEIADE
jgi:DNA-binding transcriptional regulator YiaG